MTEQYRQACNFVSQYIFDNRFNMAYQSLNRELYRDLRSQFGLKSQLAQRSEIAAGPVFYQDDDCQI
ncbi:hypothetical protein [uncultured Megasphaera sp.]|uniref:hypothetical protein n=1 Tax=uncultured Megasphaera sp. TaxID=165188 RepID=UPI00258A45E9|nr:hypothetical protein [uncultured Megasphaera sp.]